MTIQIGRIGAIGLGIEGTPGQAVTASGYLPFIENSLRGHQEPIENISARASRLMDADSVVGKKWGEGSVGINLDVVNAGYLFKLALGNEQLTVGTPNEHIFYTTVSGNAPKTATLLNDRGTDCEQYTYGSIDTLDLAVSDGLGTLTVALMSKFPTDTSSLTPTTTSGTVFSFANMEMRFGADLAAAAATSATAINEFSLSLANNLEIIHRSGSSDVSLIRTKGFKATGSYVLYFDNKNDRDAYYALNKRAMEVKFTGNANESLYIKIPEFRLDDAEIVPGGLDDFYITTGAFTAEDKVDAGVRQLQVVLNNTKGTVY